MSMSQEDIEALMNGLDIPAQDSVETIKEEPIPEDKVNTKEIEALLSQVEKNEDKDSLVSPASEKKISEIGELLNDIEDDDLGVFRFPTQSKTLAMEVNSPFYRKDTIYRNLDPARTNETIELEPDVYAKT